MATSYSVVYDAFLAKISDYSFLTLTQTDLEIQLQKYLLNCLPSFRFCKTNLVDRDNTLKQFNNTLTDYEIQILSMLMVSEYLRPKLVTSEILKQTLSDKDFSIYSQANHLKELSNLVKMFRLETVKMINDYTFSNADWKKDFLK